MSTARRTPSKTPSKKATRTSVDNVRPLTGAAHTDSVLDEHLEDMVQWAMVGMSVRQIAERLSGQGTPVHFTTVARYLKRPAVSARLAEFKQETIAQVLRQVTSAGGIAVSALVKVLTSDKAKDADIVRAADVLLRTLGIDQVASAVDEQTAAQVTVAREAMAAKVAAMRSRAVDAVALHVVPDPPEVIDTTATG